MISASTPHKIVPLSEARDILRVDYWTLRKAVEGGYVKVRRKNVWGKLAYLATLAEWERGVKAYWQAKGKVVQDEGLITATQAARRLGVSRRLMNLVAYHGMVPNLRKGPGGKRGVYLATFQDWRDGLERWREAHPGGWKRSQEAREKRKRIKRRMPKAEVSKEVARMRLAELDPYQRLNLRVFIMAVSRGYPLPQRWEPRIPFAREGEENTLV